jgi:hypothetical protein
MEKVVKLGYQQARALNKNQDSLNISSIDGVIG